MIFELNDTSKVKHIFAGWNETLIYSCIQKVMGKIYVTDIDNPKFAFAYVGCCGCLYFFGFVFWLFDYPHGGNFWGMLLAVPIFVSSVIALSLLIASFMDCAERIGHIIVASSVPLFLLSGIAWPYEAMPTWIHWIGQILPSSVGPQMFIQLNQMGVPTSLVIPKMIYLVLLIFSWL